MSEIQLVSTMDAIGQRIVELRGQRVMLDSDLAVLYGVLTKNLIKATRRNPDRFPDDFMLQLSKEEWDNLRFQFGASNWGGRRSFALWPGAAS